MSPNTSSTSDALATSESEEMYLIHIAMAGENGAEGSVPVRQLAESLSVSPVSANQMIKKLESRNLVRYAPYRGVDLTETGHLIASRVLRQRRLWAVFLVEYLGFSATEADTLACELEHVTSPEMTDRLASFLGDPGTGPGGRPIPAGDGSKPETTAVPLSSIGAGGTATVADVPTGSTFLERQSIVAGARLGVLAVGGNGDMLVQTDSGEVHLSSTIVGRIAVRSVEPS